MAQSRQEAMHARVFGAALALTGRGGSCPPAVERALERLAARLHADLDRGRLAASMLGLQVVLEGLGEVALAPPRGEAAALAALVPLRALLLRQEQAHHRLGERWLAHACLRDPAARDELRIAQAGYALHGEALVAAGARLFDGDADARAAYVDAAAASIADMRSRYG